MEAIQLKCPNCAAPIKFNAEQQCFLCEFCDSHFTNDEINAANARNEQPVSPEQQQEFSEHTNCYACESCGAEIVADENTAAAFCYYCHSPVTLRGKVSGELRPELIIPFANTREAAGEMYKKWIRRKIFAPSDFKSSAQLEKIVGLYVPYWLADCDVDADYVFDAKTVSSRTAGDKRYTTTKVYEVFRKARMTFKGIPADGSKKLDDELLDSIEPYDYTKFQPFTMSYFSGFYADKYDIDKADVFQRIMQRAKDASSTLLTADVTGYSSVSIKTDNLRSLKTTWHYAMLPVWFMTYIYNNKSYYFALNGQTGKLGGIAPISKLKVALFTAGVGVLSALIFGFLIGGLS